MKIFGEIKFCPLLSQFGDKIIFKWNISSPCHIYKESLKTLSYEHFLTWSDKKTCICLNEIIIN